MKIIIIGLGNFGMSAAIALSNTTYPYIRSIANKGFQNALLSDQSLLKGLNIFKGQVTHKGVSDAFKLSYILPEKAIA